MSKKPPPQYTEQERRAACELAIDLCRERFGNKTEWQRMGPTEREEIVQRVLRGEAPFEAKMKLRP